MAFLNRRYQVVAVLAVFVVTTLYILSRQFQFRKLSSSFAVPRASSTSQVYIPPADGQWHWGQLKQHNPLASYVKLPKGAAKRLRNVQHDFSTESQATKDKREMRQARVKQVFERCWNAYKKHAWLKDELGPLSGNAHTTFGGWAATLVDSLDTLWIMNLTSEFHEAVDAVSSIDFSPNMIGDNEINVFETTIRYLGGFLSAYDLSGDRRLLGRALEVGDMVYAAFDTPNRLPQTRWSPGRAIGGFQMQAHEIVLLAELGSMCLEFTRLSQVTGDPKWFDATERITRLFDTQQSKTKLPGMFPIVVNARDADTTGFGAFSLGSMADSTYEYFVKMYALLGGLSSVYRKLFECAMNTAITHTLFRPLTPDNSDILIAGSSIVEDGAKPRLEPQGQHLVCFAGGAFVLGGKLFGKKKFLDLGEKLTNGCIWTYRNSPSGIMPEEFSMVPCLPDDKPCRWNKTIWLDEVKIRMSDEMKQISIPMNQYVESERLEPGFTEIRDRRYSLRPEAIESVFILYRSTGRSDLQDVAWEMFEAIANATKTDIANAAISDTTTKGESPQYDSMESFWLAETLKYFYLMFSEPNVISLDEWVFNTEAHPFRRPTPGQKGWN